MAVYYVQTSTIIFLFNKDKTIKLNNSQTKHNSAIGSYFSGFQVQKQQVIMSAQQTVGLTSQVPANTLKKKRVRPIF